LIRTETYGLRGCTRPAFATDGQQVQGEEGYPLSKEWLSHNTQNFDGVAQLIQTSTARCGPTTRRPASHYRLGRDEWQIRERRGISKDPRGQQISAYGHAGSIAINNVS